MTSKEKNKFELNKNQQEAATYDWGKPLLIEAGPGAGKTLVIVERVKFLLLEKKVKPESIAVITFSRKAAQELKDRLYNVDELPASILDEMRISTIHAFCHDILKRYSSWDKEIMGDDNEEMVNLFLRNHKKDLGFDKYKSMIPNAEISNIVKRFNDYSTFNLKINDFKEHLENKLISDKYDGLINDCENKKIPYPTKYVKSEPDLEESWYILKNRVVTNAYPKYRSLLDKEALVDFALLQVEAYELLRKNPDIWENFMFKNILIDEFQDVDNLQMNIFDLIIRETNFESFTVVGDADQSIYSFRGANPKYFKRFVDDYGAYSIPLNRNYRATPKLVEINEEFMMPHRDASSKKQMEADRDEQFGVNTDAFYLLHDNTSEEAVALVKLIKSLKNKGLKNYSDIGVLFRGIKSPAGSKIKDFTKELDENNIPYIVKGNPDFTSKPEVRAVLTLLRFITPINDNHNTLKSKWERKWLNFSVFASEEVGKNIFNLSDETREIFNNLFEKFNEDILNCDEEYRLKIKRGRRLSSFEKVLSNKFYKDIKYVDDPIKNPNQHLRNLIDLVKCPWNPFSSTMEDIKNWGITNKHDLNFFQELINLRDQIKNQNNNLNNSDSKDNKMLTDLKVFYNKYLEENSLSELTDDDLNDLINDIFENDEFIEKYQGDYSDDEFDELIENNIKKLINGECSSDNLLLSNLAILYRILTILDSYCFDYKNKHLIKELSACDEDYAKEIDDYFKVKLENLASFSSTLLNYESFVYKYDIEGLYYFLLSKLEEYSSALKEEDDAIQIMTIHKAKGLEFPIVILASVKDGNASDDMKKYDLFRIPLYPTDKIFYEYEKPEHDEEEETRIRYVGMTRAQDLLFVSGISENVNDISIPPSFIKSLISTGLCEFLDDGEYDGKELSKVKNIKVREEKVMNEPLDLSFSSFKTYKHCSFKYNLSHNLGFKLSETKEMEKGIKVHKILERLNKEQIDGNEMPENLTEIKKEYDVDSKTSETVDKYWHRFGKDINVLASELPFNVNLDEEEYTKNVPFTVKDTKYQLKGKIDLVYKTGEDTVGILDYKNSSMQSINRDSDFHTMQLYMYIKALSRHPDFKDKTVNEISVYSLRDHEHKYFEIKDNIDEILEKRLNPFYNGVKESKYSCANDQTKCKYCDFLPICNSN